MNETERKWACETILHSPFFKKYSRGDTWISGSSTVVYPLTAWWDERVYKARFEIRLAGAKSHKGRYAAFRNLLNKLKRRFPGLEGRFFRFDGSCPDIYIIYELAESEVTK